MVISLPQRATLRTYRSSAPGISGGLIDGKKFKAGKKTRVVVIIVPYNSLTSFRGLFNIYTG
jgi:hypothetical protein